MLILAVMAAWAVTGFLVAIVFGFFARRANESFANRETNQVAVLVPRSRPRGSVVARARVTRVAGTRAFSRFN